QDARGSAYTSRSAFRADSWSVAHSGCRKAKLLTVRVLRRRPGLEGRPRAHRRVEEQWRTTILLFLHSVRAPRTVAGVQSAESTVQVFANHQAEDSSVKNPKTP